jgi:threonine dehydratase
MINYFNHEQINNAMPMSKCVEIMEQMFTMLSHNNEQHYFSFPVRTVLPVPPVVIPSASNKKVSVLGYMPSFANLSSSIMTSSSNSVTREFIATKVITVNIPSEETHQGVVLLFDANSGELIGVFDAKCVTAIRTAACSAVAARHLTRNSKSVRITLVGSGEQARMHALSLSYVFKTYDHVQITVAGRNESKLKQCVSDIKKDCTIDNISISYTTNIESAVRSATIICTLTTSATPILKREWLNADSLVIAVGACKADMREIDSDTIRDSTVIVDKLDAALKEAGDILIPISEKLITESHIYSELGDIVSKKKQVPESGIIVFKSLGLAIEDLVTCAHIYLDTSISDTQIQSETIVDQIQDIYPFPQLHHIQKAKKNIERISIVTPLIQLNDSENNNVYLKLENLQPIGSYKLRPAANVLLSLRENDPIKFQQVQRVGVVTCSAGNFAQGLAFVCSQLNIPCTIIVPSHAPDAKRNAIARINNNVSLINMEMDQYWNTLVNEKDETNPDLFFISPVTNPYCMAGNGTIALEVLEQLPKSVAPEDLVVVVPYGGGAMTLGICIALKSINPKIQVYACEVDTAAPFKASLDKGEPTEVAYQPSFVDGIGSKSVFPSNFSKLKEIIDGSLVVTLSEVSQALKLLLERNHVVAEGAGASSVAAALKYKNTHLKNKTVVSIISGGNIDLNKLVQIINNQSI